MAGGHVACPACGIVLRVPEGFAETTVRCGRCRNRFRLPDQLGITEDSVVGWLREGRGLEEDGDRAAAAPARQTDVRAKTLTEFVPHKPPPRAGMHIRLVRFGSRGALFEFPTSQLLDANFRCGMPRECCRCGVRTHLSAHVVLFTPHLQDSLSLEAEHTAGKLVLSEDEARRLTDYEVLARLPRVPNVPPPGDLPMPYWLCDACSGAGVISGQIQVNPDTGTGWCRLLIRNLDLAEKFIAKIGGKGTRAHSEIRKRLIELRQDPWKTMPEAVQHRLEQWFRPSKSERFIAYVPDRGRARTEDGMAGLVVSSRRLIYHTNIRHHEVTVDKPLDLQLAMAGGRGNLRIKAPSWEVRHIAVDRDGIDCLRKALSAVRFEAKWH
jgi:hypothetical protein